MLVIVASTLLVRLFVALRLTKRTKPTMRTRQAMPATMSSVGVSIRSFLFQKRTVQQTRDPSKYTSSVLMQHFVSSAMQRVTDGSLQPGIFVIDPHFDFIADLLQLIPPDRLADLLLLDLTD